MLILGITHVVARVSKGYNLIKKSAHISPARGKSFESHRRNGSDYTTVNLLPDTIIRPLN